MIHGSELHADLRKTLREQETGERLLSDRLYDCERRITRLTQEREEIYGRMALRYLPELSAESVRRTLREVQADVEAIFVERQRRRQAVEKELEALAGKSVSLDAELGALEQRRADHATLEASLKEKVLADLRLRDDYGRHRAELKRAQEDIDVLNNQVELLEKVAERQRASYESHPLFRYLLERRYGEKDFVGGMLGFLLDGWVAGHIDFVRQRAAYALLVGGPRSLKTLAERRRSEGVGFEQQAKAVEREIAGRHGLLAALEETKRLELERVGLLERISGTASETELRRDERTDLDSTRGTHHAQAIERLKGFLKGKEILELKATTGPEGRKDAVRIETIDAEIRIQKDNAKSIQREQAEQSRRLKELRLLESRFLSEGYDGRSVRFNTGLDLPSLMLGLLAGRETASTIGAELRRHHYVPPPPVDTSSHWMSSSSSFSSFGSSSSSSSFSSGGGSSSSGSSGGGGGFSTGGGF